MSRLLRARLEGSGFFGARFREAAGRALLLPRASARGRTPLWLTRLRAKSLLAAVNRYEDFPLVLEAWRTCLQEEFDLPSLGIVLGELAAAAIHGGRGRHARPRPRSAAALRGSRPTCPHVPDDTPTAGAGRGTARARADLVRELALSAELRPRVSPLLAAAFQAKLQRTAEGYAPRDSREVLDWLKDRVILPAAEWRELLAASARDAGGRGTGRLEEELAPRISEQVFGDQDAVTAAEVEPRLRKALENDDEVLGELVAQWLRYYGPIQPSRISLVFGVGRERLDAILDDLVQEEVVVLDRLLAGSEDLLICDRENLEALLRISRARARPPWSRFPRRGCRGSSPRTRALCGGERDWRT